MSAPFTSKNSVDHEVDKFTDAFARAAAVLISALFISAPAHAGGHSRHKPQPSPSVTASPTPDPTPTMNLLRTEEISATSVKWSRAGKALNQNVGSNLSSNVTTANSGVETQIKGTVLGKSRSLISASSEANTNFTSAKTDVYAGGLQLVSLDTPLNTGPLSKHYELAPIQLKLASINFPVGPILVNVEGGLSLEASVDAELIPYIAVPVEDSSLVIHIAPKASSNAFIEGSASILVLKGGVGGDVSILDADLQAYGTVFANTTIPPNFMLNGHVGFFKGQLYGFAKVFNIFQLGWSTIWKATFFSWPGACYEFKGNFEKAGSCSP